MTMEVYEEMWKGLVQRMVNAQKFSIRQDVTLSDMINLMAAFEDHYKEELQELEDIKIEEETGLEPITDDRTQQL